MARAKKVVHKKDDPATSADESQEIDNTQTYVAHADEGVTSCHWGGKIFEAETDGTFLVPVEALEDLRSHGFELA